MSGLGLGEKDVINASPSESETPSSLIDFTFEQLKLDGELALLRGRHMHSIKTIMVAQPAATTDAEEAEIQLNNEYTLRNALDQAWSMVPRASIKWHGSIALVYDDLDAITLDQHISRPLAIDTFLEFAIAISKAVRCMHAAGILHNNLKPSNFLIDKSGACRVTGFGAATLIQNENSPNQAWTLSGAFAYMSPEHTGRTKHKINPRSDLYSLGVTFYELLTGKLPFNLNNDAERADWIHQHLASEPNAPHTIYPGIPKQLSLLVLKLLSKAPEFRYQTAAGLENDLKRCLRIWKSSRRIDEFALGLHEKTNELIFHDKLYFRETSLQTLGAAFDQVTATRKRTLAIVSGYSGIGKSSLLSSFLGKLSLQHAIIATGKVDQYRKDLPYAAFAQAFHGLIMNILGQPDQQVLYWRERLRQVLDAYGRFAVNLIPALKHLVGDLPPVPDLPVHEAQHKFNAVMQNLVSVFATSEFPLVLVIDDLQWIDLPSFHLLELLMSSPKEIPLLLIVAYRSEAVVEIPSFQGMLDKLHPLSTQSYDINLSALSAKSVERLIADTLHQSSRDVRELSRLVYEKTNGNPFFVKQFLKAISDDGLIVLDTDNSKWWYDLAGIRERGYTDNVAALVLESLNRMPLETQHLLVVLACLGRHSSVELLARIGSKSVSEVKALLEPALNAEAIFLANEGYGFCHDKVQEAAYILASENQRMHLHFVIGKTLLANARQNDSDEDLFRAYDHLSIAAPIIVDPVERLDISQVGLLAAQKAKRAIAYDSALIYINTALSLVPIEDMSQGHELSFLLKLEWANCQLLSGNLPEASKTVEELLLIPSFEEIKACVFRLKTEIHVRRAEYTKAVDIALEGLGSLGILIKRRPTESDCEVAYHNLLLKLTQQPERVLLGIKPLQDPKIEAAMTLLTELSVPATFTDDRLHFLQLCNTLDLTLEHGITGPSTVALSWFGVLVGHRFSKYEDGFRYGQLARVLVTQHRYLAYEAKTLLALDQLSVWTQPLSFSVECTKAGFAAGVTHGDITMACFECCHQVANYYTRGDHLDLVWAEAERGLAFVRQAAFQDVEAILAIQMRFVDNFRKVGDKPFSGNAIVLSDLDYFTGKDQERMPTLVFWFWLYKAISHYLASEFEQALWCMRKAEDLAWSAPGHIHLLDFHLFYALTHAARHSASDDLELLNAKIQPHLNKLTEWTAVNPNSFADKEALLQAELARVRGESWKAHSLYDTAIHLAEEKGFVQYAAFAHELAARFCLNAGLMTSAKAHLIGARSAYQNWGATAKVKQLEHIYSHHMQKQLISHQLGAVIAESSESRELASVIRSVRALSEEIHLDNLIKVLMTITIELAGAQRGLLIRMHGNSPFIAAHANTSPEGIHVTLVQDLPEATELPLSMLQTAIRTLQLVHFSGSKQPSPFSTDLYLQSRTQCAAMCIPLVKRAELIGVLYLENRLLPDAFTEKHARLLEVLAAQAAISLEVARLYAELVKENQQRQKVESELRTSEASLELGEEISHTGSWRWDIEQDVITCSAEFCRIFGIDLAHRLISFGNLMTYIHPDDRSLVIDSVRSSTNEHRSIRVEYRIVRPDGTIRYLLGVGRPTLGENEHNHYVGTVSDVTMRRASEDALRTSQAELARVTRISTVGQLTASIAHEINQPLMSIVSNGGAGLRWLNRNPPELEEVRAGLQEIVNEAGRAGHIIRSLQALTRNSEPIMKQVDMHDTVRLILAISRSEIESRAVSIQLTLAARTYQVQGDGVQLQQVLLNLVVNAIDAMSDVNDRPRLLSISSHNPDAEHILVCVQDTGVGLSQEEKEKIFDAFFTTKQNGMGMGLSICKSILEAHQGKLEVATAQPYGSVFYFVLPVMNLTS